MNQKVIYLKRLNVVHNIDIFIIILSSSYVAIVKPNNFNRLENRLKMRLCKKNIYWISMYKSIQGHYLFASNNSLFNLCAPHEMINEKPQFIIGIFFSIEPKICSI